MPDASRVFIDSNVLLYAVSGRVADAGKAALARRLLRDEPAVISFQVLAEFYANAIHPRKLGLSQREAMKICETWMLFPVAQLGAETFARVLELVRRCQISHWDAAIIASAEQMNCAILYTEDLNHGQQYGSVRVINPFV